MNSSTLTVIRNDTNSLKRRKVESLIKKNDIPTLLVTDQPIQVKKPITRKSYKALETSLKKNISPFEEFRLVILGETSANMNDKALIEFISALQNPTLNIYIEHPGIDNLRLLFEVTKEKIRTLNVLAVTETGHLPETIAIGFDRLVTNQIDYGTYQAINQFSRRKNFNIEKVEKYLKQVGASFRFEFLDHYTILSEEEFTPLFNASTKKKVEITNDESNESAVAANSGYVSKNEQQQDTDESSETLKKLADIKSLIGTLNKEVISLHTGQRKSVTTLELEPFHKYNEQITEQLDSIKLEKKSSNDELIDKLTELNDRTIESLVNSMKQNIEQAIDPLISLLSDFNNKKGNLSESDSELLKTISDQLKTIKSNKDELNELAKMQKSLREYLSKQEKEYVSSLSRIEKSVSKPNNELAIQTQTREFGKSILKEFINEIADDDLIQLGSKMDYLGNPDDLMPMKERLKERLGK